MPNFARIAALLLVIGASPLQAAEAADDTALSRAMTRGRMIQLYDQAAWHTTDDMLAKLPKSRLNELGGWVVTQDGDVPRVDFFGKGEMAGRSIYSAELRDGRVINAQVHAADALPALSPAALRAQAALTNAREELIRKGWVPCTRGQFNAVVLPPQEDGMMPVYFLSPQVGNDIPFGGHFEIDIAGDGTVARSRSFSNSCINLPRPKADKAGGEPAMLFLTHLLDPQPTEVHVFQQMATGVPLVLGTVSNKRLWIVAGGQIRDGGPLPEK